MTATEIVLLVIRVEGIALAVVLLGIFGYAMWSRADRSSRAARLTSARQIIAAHLEDKTISDAQFRELDALSFGDQRRLFFDVAASVGPSERAWLRDLATRLGTLRWAVEGTSSYKWWIRLWSVRLLTLLDVDPGVIHPLLHDGDELVRAAVATYISQHPTPEGIAALIAMLDDPAPRCRVFARDALMRLGSLATPAVVGRLANPDDPQTVQLLEVACAVATHDYLPAAALRASDSRPRVRALVTRLLRNIGGANAVTQLTALLHDDDARVRAAAAEALGYLNQWAASSAIARLLDDTDSRVRLAAALALNQLGPAGELLLRRARAKGSERAAIAASRILDDPSRTASVPALTSAPG